MRLGERNLGRVPKLLRGPLVRLYTPREFWRSAQVSLVITNQIKMAAVRSKHAITSTITRDTVVFYKQSRMRNQMDKKFSGMKLNFG